MKKNYIIREGWNNLEKELKFLWREERLKVTQALSEAAALGDSSENAEIFMVKSNYEKLIDVFDFYRSV